LEQWLCRELHPNSILILDNAPIHRKNRIHEIADARGHQVLFLPRYSPDLKSIEHDSAAMKKRRKYAPEAASIAQIVKGYSERHNPSILI
ncbi:MAG: transposase, partial [Cyanobacteria bacterium J06635_13]